MFKFGESGILGQGVVIRIGRFPVQTPLGVWLGLGTQPIFEAPGDLQLETVKTQWLTLVKWGCPLDNSPKMAVGHPYSS